MSGKRWTETAGVGQQGGRLKDEVWGRGLSMKAKGQGVMETTAGFDNLLITLV